MHFSEISYEKNFRVYAADQFIYEKIAAKVFLNEDDNPMNAITMARDFVNEQGSSACVYPEHAHIEEKYIPESQLPEIQVEKADIRKMSLEDQIKACENRKDLREYKLLAEMNQKLYEVWAAKEEELLSKELSPKK